MRRKKKWKDPVKSYHSSLYFLWQTKSGYMIGPGSKKNKLADESTRCTTFTEKSWCRRSWHLMGLNFCKANFCFISSAVVSVWVHYLKSPPKKEGKNTRNIWIMTSKTQIEFFRPKFLFLGNFFISTLSMTTSHLSFLLSNPLQRKMEKIRGMSE